MALKNAHSVVKVGNNLSERFDAKDTSIGVWNQELYDMYIDIDVVKRIKIQSLRWLDRVAPMDSSSPVRKVFESQSGGGCRRQRCPPQRWAKQVHEYLTTFGIRNWRQTATARDVRLWRLKLAEAKTCNRL